MKIDDFRNIFARCADSILVNGDDPAVRVERLKMVANGLQVIALGIMAAAIIAPLFNPALKPGMLVRVGGGQVAGLIEVLALRVIGYISVQLPTDAGDEE